MPRFTASLSNSSIGPATPLLLLLLVAAAGLVAALPAAAVGAASGWSRMNSDSMRSSDSLSASNSLLLTMLGRLQVRHHMQIQGSAKIYLNE
jgi:hypothetical protein